MEDEYDAIVVIPYRNRLDDLEKFKKVLPNCFTAQNIRALFVVAEQADALPFNRGKLINAAWDICLGRYPSARGFYFHDVDVWPHIPTALNYKLPKENQAIHIYGIDNIYKSGHMYYSYGGTVGCLSRDAVLTTNGFPNDFWSWGAEDNVLGLRIHEKGVHIDLTSKVLRGSPTIDENMKSDRNYDHYSLNVRKLHSRETEVVENGISNCRYRLVDDSIDLDGFLWLGLDLSEGYERDIGST
jgi:hypothetical protein